MSSTVQKLQSVFGRTAGDLRRIAAETKVKQASVIVQTGPEFSQREVLLLPISALLKSLSHLDDDDLMPCEFYTRDGVPGIDDGRRLMLGGCGAIDEASRAEAA